MEKEEKQQPEVRAVNMSIGKPGGTASKGAYTYRVAIPTAWAQSLGITPDDRALKVTFDGKRITIERP